jgi:hypothetical protein
LVSPEGNILIEVDTKAAKKVLFWNIFRDYFRLQSKEMRFKLKTKIPDFE